MINLQNEFLWLQKDEEFWSFFVMEIGQDGWVKLQPVSSEKTLSEVEYLKEWMNDNGISRAQLAAALGVSPSTVTRWLSYEHRIPDEVFDQLKIDRANLRSVIKDAFLKGMQNDIDSLQKRINKHRKEVVNEQLKRK